MFISLAYGAISVTATLSNHPPFHSDELFCLFQTLLLSHPFYFLWTVLTDISKYVGPPTLKCLKYPRPYKMLNCSRNFWHFERVLTWQTDMTHTCLFISFGSMKLGWSGVSLKRHFVTLWNADMLQCIQTNGHCTLATCWCINNSCLTTFFLLGLQTCQPRRACCIYTSKIVRHAALLFS